MKLKPHWIFNRYMRPEDTGGTGGGAVDRGDNWTPTDDETPPAKGEKAGEKEPAAKEDKKAGARDDGEADDNKTKDDEDEPKGDDDEEGKDADKKGKKDSRVPLARHKEILQRERAQRETLERELAQLKQGQQVAKTNEDIAEAEDKVVGMEKEYLELLEKGDVKAAAAKMAEIRRAERSIVEQKQAFHTQAAEARAYERVKYDTTVERLEAAFPVINPDHDDFDKEKTAEVIEMRDAYIATGRYTRAEALQKACKNLLGAETKKQEAATDVDVRVDKEEVAKQLKEDRKKAQVEKNLDAAAKQPPNAANVGQDSDKAGGKLKPADVLKMDQKTFAALSEAEKSRLRGDDF